MSQGGGDRVTPADIVFLKGADMDTNKTPGVKYEFKYTISIHINPYHYSSR